MKRIFVYGTLKYDHYNHYLLKNSKREKDCVVNGFDMYTNGSFPMIIPGKNNIECEVYLISNEKLKNLDKLENIPNLYIRRKVMANDSRWGFIYIYNDTVKNLKKIDSFDWSNF